MCSCSKTIFDIIELTNDMRRHNGLKEISYTRFLREWHGLVDGYSGRRNPYKPSQIIGNNYIFTDHKMKKIARKVATVFVKDQDTWKNYFWAA